MCVGFLRFAGGDRQQPKKFSREEEEEKTVKGAI
jgi:hypothetical protein